MELNTRPSWSYSVIRPSCLYSNPCLLTKENICANNRVTLNPSKAVKGLHLDSSDAYGAFRVTVGTLAQRYILSLSKDGRGHA